MKEDSLEYLILDKKTLLYSYNQVIESKLNKNAGYYSSFLNIDEILNSNTYSDNYGLINLESLSNGIVISSSIKLVYLNGRFLKAEYCSYDYFVKSKRRFLIDVLV